MMRCSRCVSQWTKSLCLSDIKWLFFFLVGKVYIIIIDDTVSKVGKLSIRNSGLGASKWTVLTGCSGWHGGHRVHDPPGAAEPCAFMGGRIGRQECAHSWGPPGMKCDPSLCILQGHGRARECLARDRPVQEPLVSCPQLRHLPGVFPPSMALCDG